MRKNDYDWLAPMCILRCSDAVLWGVRKTVLDLNLYCVFYTRLSFIWEANLKSRPIIPAPTVCVSMATIFMD